MKRKEVKVRCEASRPKWICSFVKDENGKYYLEQKRPNATVLKVEITDEISALIS
jgi:hypothetical protein